MAAPKKRGLGKGLESLFGDVEIKAAEVVAKEEASSYDEDKVVFLDINRIKPNLNQPRKNFDEEKIRELADSILEHGLIQPIVVRRREQGYEIVAGERRYRAAREAKLKTIPCLIRELSDEQNMLLAIIENVQREDLNPIEEAFAINQMIDTYGLTQEQVSKSISKSRPYITNSLRLLRLPEQVRNMVAEGVLTAGHARAILSAEGEENRVRLAKRAQDEGLSVRELERVAGEKKKGRPAARTKKRNADVAVIEAELKTVLGTRVNIKDKGKGGRIEIEYYSRDELERLLELLKTLE